MSLFSTALRQVREAGAVSLILFRIMVPVVIAVKLLEELGAVKYIAAGFKPLMNLVGLPGEMGLVWATSVLTNMYGGMATFASLAPELHLTTAQTTVMACMILVAHSMAVETTIAGKSGVRAGFMVPFRLLSAILLGFLLHRAFDLSDILRGESRILWEASGGGGSIPEWAVEQVRNLAAIYVIVLFLIVLMKILDKAGVTRAMNRLLAPVLSSMGISESASMVTILGMVLGISYGGGLIIKYVRSGRLSDRDVFFSISLMSILHAVIEDTLLMISIGGSILGVFFARMLFTWMVMRLMVGMVNAISDETFYRVFFKRNVKETSSQETVSVRDDDSY